MALKPTMPARQDARPGTSDSKHASDYDPDRGGWYAAEKTKSDDDKPAKGKSKQS